MNEGIVAIVLGQALYWSLHYLEYRRSTDANKKQNELLVDQNKLLQQIRDELKAEG